MRWLLLGLIGVWGLLSLVAYTVILPSEGRDDRLIAAYLIAGSALDESGGWAASDDGGDDRGMGRGSDPSRSSGDPVSSASRVDSEFERVIAAFVERASELWKAQAQLSQEFTRSDMPGILRLPESEREAFFEVFRGVYEEITGSTLLADAPVLVWSTDDNPARRVQCQLFRVWHLREYGTPVDIVTDPSNRDATKAIVQSTAGVGPDLVEAYGPAELGQFVDAGIAKDVTARAERDGFGVETVFEAARSSIAVRDPETGEWVQYGYPCNVGYTVLFYHRDMFASAGVAEPNGGWTLDEAIAVGKRLMAAEGDEGGGSRRRVGIMNLGAWDMALAGGGRFLNSDGTASGYNSAETVEAFRTFQSMMYEDRVMPSPAEAASMAASGGANMNAGAEAASASALFAAKVTGMYVGGRWEYVSLAHRNRDRVIVPAIARRLGELERGADDEAALAERALLESVLDVLRRDVLVPLNEAQRSALESVLTGEDRSRLIQLGVAHVPTLTGVPYYSAAARVALVNRSSPRTEYAERFLRFLASEAYNEQINQTFDSICGVPAFCFDEDGISGPPSPLPGLEAFDSVVFAEAMRDYASDRRLSPFIGRNRLGLLAGQVMERLTNNEIGAGEAARLIERRINDQIAANLRRDAALRAEWERLVGVSFDPDRDVREQVEAARGGSLEVERVGARQRGADGARDGGDA